MAAERVNTPSKSEEASAGTAGPDSGAPVATGGFKPWLPLLVTILAMPALAYAMTEFVLLPKLQKGLGITASAREDAQNKAAKDDPNAKKESFAINKLLVNVAGTMGARYLLVSLSLVGADPDFKSKIEAHEPQLKDMACGVLSTKSLADLEKPGARNLIRSELISGFNNILGGALIQEIYLTEFAIQ